MRTMPSLNDTARGRILFGGDYNPEQWPEEIWAKDARLMREAGVNSVTLGVFSWAKLEPRPGVRVFGWLDRLMDLMHGHGIGVVLATPTSSPPPWLGRLHPETLPRDENGQVEWWGSRQHFAHSSAVYRRYAAAITEDLAARYAHHPALTMWHINNEYCTYDWGDEAAAAFRRWLQGRYGSLSSLNSAWGSAFWGQDYDAWEGVLPPRRAHQLPAVLRRGRAWYVSTLPEPSALRDLLTRAAAQAGARPPLDGLPRQVEAVRRGALLFLLHHGRGEVSVAVPGRHRELLTGRTVEGTISLGRYAVAVLEEAVRSEAGGQRPAV